MAHHSMPEPDFDGPEPASSTDVQLSPESDLAKLVAKFSAHGGGNLPPELAVDLALEVVLNEIVEQACLATRATAAAVILERDGEMVCRASSGVNAPELGARLSSESGLTAECIKTRQVQRCDDAAADPRVDVEACRSLGVRSFLILPLVRNNRVAGVLEVFSSRPGAFAGRDELTLEGLAQRVLRNLERAEEPFGAAPQNLTTMPAPEISKVEDEQQQSLEEDHGGSDGVNPASFSSESVSAETLGRSSRTALDILTFALGAAVVVCAVLLTTLIGLRLGWFGTASRREHSVGQGVPATGQAGVGTVAASVPALSSSSSSSGLGKSDTSSEKKNVVASPRTSGSSDAAPPPGSLFVYEDGKEVFHMAPGGKTESAEPSGVVEVLPEVAQGALLHRVEPDYPEDAREQQIQGPVELKVRAGRDGTVQDVKLLSGQPVLADAAIAAVRQWRFRPHTVKGQPVEMETKVTLNFRLPQ